MPIVQRFGGALNLNVHFHAIVLDGVHVQRIDGSLLCHVLPQMRKAECLALTETIACRVRRLLARRGLLADDAGPPNDETPSALLRGRWSAVHAQVWDCADKGKVRGRAFKFPIRRELEEETAEHAKHCGRSRAIVAAYREEVMEPIVMRHVGSL